MENEVEEENKREKLTTSPDWLDLPDPIATNIILEHLDIVDYIRFSAVYKKWQSIQKEHRIWHSPYPPHLPLTFPWHSGLFLAHDNFCLYLTSKEKTCNVPLFKSSNKIIHFCHYSHGWLIFHLATFYDIHKSLFILNPITSVKIELPQFKSILIKDAYISSPPTDPDCALVMLGYDNVHVYQLNKNTGLIKTPYSIRNGEIFLCHKKIYQIVGSYTIRIIDAILPDLVEHIVEMDCSDICFDQRRTPYLMDFLGELVMILVVYDKFLQGDYENIEEFHVYRADFSTNKWILMESFGDHALFFGYRGMFFLPTVDVGCQKNTIYLPRDSAWRAFNISTKIWVDGHGPPMSLPNKSGLGSFWTWFLPSLDYYDAAKTNGACRIQSK